MNYIQRNLRPNEKIVMKARISLLPMFVMLVLTIIVAVVFKKLGAPNDILAYVLIIGAVLVLFNYLRSASVELAVTDKKIIGKRGVLFPRSMDAYLEKVDNISVSTGLLGTIFGYATVEICTNSAHLRFPLVKKSMVFKHKVMDCIEMREDEKFRIQAGYNSAAHAQIRQQEVATQVTTKPATDKAPVETAEVSE